MSECHIVHSGSCPSACVTSLSCHLDWWALGAERGNPHAFSGRRTGRLARRDRRIHDRLSARVNHVSARRAPPSRQAPTPSRGRLRENYSGENYCRPGVTTRCSPTARSDDPGLGAAPRACHHRAGLRPLQRRRWPTCRQGRPRHLACAAITGHLLRAAAALASLVCAKARTATIRRDPVNVAARNGHGHLALHLPDAGTDRPAPMNVLEPPSVHPAT